MNWIFLQIDDCFLGLSSLQRVYLSTISWKPWLNMQRVNCWKMSVVRNVKRKSLSARFRGFNANLKKKVLQIKRGHGSGHGLNAAKDACMSEKWQSKATGGLPEIVPAGEEIVSSGMQFRVPPENSPNQYRPRILSNNLNRNHRIFLAHLQASHFPVRFWVASIQTEPRAPECNYPAWLRGSGRARQRPTE